MFKIVALGLKILIWDIGRYIKSILLRASWVTKGVAIDVRVTITVTGGAKIQLHTGVVIRRGAILIASDEKSECNECALTVGERTAINEYANIRAADGVIQIGSDVLISQFVTVVASNYDVQLSRDSNEWQWQRQNTGVRIGDRVWIGAGAIVLPGVCIGKDAVIGAGSVVTRNVPPGEVWAGNPAKRLK